MIKPPSKKEPAFKGTQKPYTTLEPAFEGTQKPCTTFEGKIHSCTPNPNSHPYVQTILQD